jgi:hypothetical protein
MYAKSNNIGIDKNAGPDNAAHDNHGGIEHAEQLPRFDCLFVQTQRR